jgi:nitrite reductase/ring-hydroxylating ferredoxin subunit
MDMPTSDFVHAGSLAELKAKGRLVVHGRHPPILLIYDGGRVFALDNRCPHMGFPLDRGSVEDGILTCHWHHARFDVASGCTFDLWADDIPVCPVEVRDDGEIWIKPAFARGDPAGHWRQRLEDGLAHDLGLVIAKAVRGQLTAGVPQGEILRQAALFAVRNRDSWGVGATILTALGNLLPLLPDEETYLALFHGARRVAADCDGATPRRERAPLASRPDRATPGDGCATGVPYATAKPLSAPCSPPSPAAPRRPRSPACWSRLQRIAPSRTAGTRSTSSTRPANAST